MAKLSSIFNKANLVFLVLLLILIVAGFLVLEPMNFATWPAFMIMIFFFIAHMNIKEAPAILIGSAFSYARARRAWTLCPRLANIRARKSRDRIIKAGGRS